MKKIAQIAALAAIASVTVSANAATQATNTVGTSGTSIVITPTTTATAGDLEFGLKETVTLQLSTGNQGAVVTNSSSTTYGYAVGSTKGKGKIYSGASSGGAIVEDDVGSAAGVTTTAVPTKAAARSGT
jgi:hypothetical protein